MDLITSTMNLISWLNPDSNEGNSIEQPPPHLMANAKRKENIFLFEYYVFICIEHYPFLGKAVAGSKLFYDIISNVNASSLITTYEP